MHPKTVVGGPSEGQVADAYKKALALQGKTRAAKAHAAKPATKESAEAVGGEEKEAAALEHTAASLRQLATAMDAPGFVASPGRLANIASNLALVSNSLSLDAKKEATLLHH